ncbi:MAG: carbohydrate kinase [Saprospiraceae bacterium]|nr:carbohydrate kinase [Saprospiraceae bacterium]
MNKGSEVILIFDIGKSNQKFFLLDRNFCTVDQGQTEAKELLDDEGDPIQDLDGIATWIAKVMMDCMRSEKHHLSGINFTTYEPRLVNLDEDGQRATPHYSCDKAFPYPLFEEFTLRYNDGGQRDLTSGSPGIGLINSGFQLYWLKYRKPEMYRKIRWALHLPQYFSYLLTGIPVSDYTSLGCHSALWNYDTQKYDRWVTAEKIDHKLAPLLSAYTSINTMVFDRRMTVGVGVSESSARLLPYLSAVKKPFILVLTGTWCVSLNPFSGDQLSVQDIARGGLYYMRIDGEQILANRCHLGFEFERQIEKLARLYNVSIKKIKKIQYNPALDQTIRRAKERYFHFEGPGVEEARNNPLPDHFKLKQAYHQLMVELVDIQVRSIKSIIKKTDIRKMFIEGEFVHNLLYSKMIARQFDGFRIYTSEAPAGAAFGAAIALAPEWWSKKHFKNYYQLKRVK